MANDRYPPFTSGDADIARAYNGLGDPVAADMDKALTAEIRTYKEGAPANSAVVLLHASTRDYTIPASLTGSKVVAGVAATASTTFSVKKNGTQFATIVFSTSGTVATFAGTETDFTSGDILSIVAPASADATLANISFNLLGAYT